MRCPPPPHIEPFDCILQYAPVAGFYTVTVTGVVVRMPPSPTGDLLMTVYLYVGSWSWVLLLHCYSARSGGWDAPPQARGSSDDCVFICRLLELGSTLLQ
jgi:hypothetical protein